MTKVITLSELAANIRCRRSGKMFLISFINMAIKMGWKALQANGLELDRIINCCEEFLKK